MCLCGKLLSSSPVSAFQTFLEKVNNKNELDWLIPYLAEFLKHRFISQSVSQPRISQVGIGQLHMIWGTVLQMGQMGVGMGRRISGRSEIRLCFAG